MISQPSALGRKVLGRKVSQSDRRALALKGVWSLAGERFTTHVRFQVPRLSGKLRAKTRQDSAGETALARAQSDADSNDKWLHSSF